MDELLITIAFTIKDDLGRHPGVSSEDRMKLDKLALTGDTERLLELLATVPYKVTVTKV